MDQKAAHVELGRLGEQMATEYLQKKGYLIIFRNWHFGKAELDIVAKHKGLLIFVEVKTRTKEIFGYPETAVSKSKQLQLSRAADACIEALAYTGEVRYDIISIILNQFKQEIFHIEDAFFPTF